MTKDDWSDILFEVECFITTLTLTVLKFCGVIQWFWFWVLFPVWALLIIKALIHERRK